MSLITMLENRKKIIAYRIYKKMSYMKGRRLWHSWYVFHHSKLRKDCDSVIKTTTEAGTYRIARVREDGSIDWILEVAR